MKTNTLVIFFPNVKNQIAFKGITDYFVCSKRETIYSLPSFDKSIIYFLKK